MDTWVISILIAIAVGVTPFTFAAFVVSGIDKNRYGRSALTVWYAGHKLAALLLIICDLVKPALTFVLVSLLFHNDVLGVYMALITSIFSYYTRFFKFYITGSPIPLLGFSIILDPNSGILLCIIYMVILIMCRRAFTSCILISLLAPCIAILMADSNTPIVLTFVLPLFMLGGFKNKILKYYPLNEHKLPRLI